MGVDAGRARAQQRSAGGGEQLGRRQDQVGHSRKGTIGVLEGSRGSVGRELHRFAARQKFLILVATAVFEIDDGLLALESDPNKPRYQYVVAGDHQEQEHGGEHDDDQ